MKTNIQKYFEKVIKEEYRKMAEEIRSKRQGQA